MQVAQQRRKSLADGLDEIEIEAPSEHPVTYVGAVEPIRVLDQAGHAPEDLYHQVSERRAPST